MNYYFNDIEKIDHCADILLSYIDKTMRSRKYKNNAQTKETGFIRKISLTMLELKTVYHELKLNNDTYKVQDNEIIDKNGNLRNKKESEL